MSPRAGLLPTTPAVPRLRQQSQLPAGPVTPGLPAALSPQLPPPRTGLSDATCRASCCLRAGSPGTASSGALGPSQALLPRRGPQGRSRHPISQGGTTAAGPPRLACREQRRRVSQDGDEAPAHAPPGAVRASVIGHRSLPFAAWWELYIASILSLSARQGAPSVTGLNTWNSVGTIIRRMRGQVWTWTGGRLEEGGFLTFQVFPLLKLEQLTSFPLQTTARSSLLRATSSPRHRLQVDSPPSRARRQARPWAACRWRCPLPGTEVLASCRTPAPPASRGVRLMPGSGGALAAGTPHVSPHTHLPSLPGSPAGREGPMAR